MAEQSCPSRLQCATLRPDAPAETTPPTVPTALQADAQCEALQGALERLQQRVTAARTARGALCDRREALTARNTAMAALSARRRRDGPPAPQTLPSTLPENPVSPPPPEPPVSREPLVPVLESNRRRHDSGRHRSSGRAPRASCGSQHRPVHPLPKAVTSSPQTVFAAAPPAVTPITSFAHLDSISFEDLLEASGSRTRDVDFSRMGMLALVDRCQQEKLRSGRVENAGRHVRATGAGAAADRVCWFVHTSAPASTDQELSLSSTLSSPECIASTVLHYMLAKIEGALLTAESEEVSGTVSLRAMQTPRSHQDVALPPLLALRLRVAARQRAHFCAYALSLDVRCVLCGMTRKFRACMAHAAGLCRRAILSPGCSGVNERGDPSGYPSCGVLVFGVHQICSFFVRAWRGVRTCEGPIVWGPIATRNGRFPSQNVTPSLACATDHQVPRIAHEFTNELAITRLAHRRC